ncbi:MAG: hypothetical protein JRD69_04165 [Deltaproteobacteria bacterium]|nr:hypothetical protein [Deltaproteobacteria bacterium]
MWRHIIEKGAISPLFYVYLNRPYSITDVRDLSRIADIKGLETLVEILPTKVSSQISIPSLSEDLGKKYDTIKNWIDILQGLYLVFTLRPWHKNNSTGNKKGEETLFL